jgi:hypothetical protein
VKRILGEIQIKYKTENGNTESDKEKEARESRRKGRKE